MLAGEKSADDIVINPLEWYQQNGIDLRARRAHRRRRSGKRKTVTGDDGSVTPYDTLLLATGSTAFMPPIEGVDKDDVFVFRTLDDTRALLERSRPGRARRW